MANTLDNLPVESRTIIRSVNGNNTFVCRMYELGIVPGSQIEVASKAPFSGPIHLRMSGFSFFMRRHDAKQIVCD